MRIFLTGATGVVGRRVLPVLIRSGHQVTAPGRSALKRDALSRAGANALDLDLFDRAAVHDAIAGHEAIINLATHMPPSMTRMLLPWAWRENDRVRRVASAVLVDAAIAAGATRFIQESFAPIYEDGGDQWIDEEWPVRTASYNRTVLDAEHSARRFAERGGAGIVLRFGGFYGPDAFTLREMGEVVRRGWAPLPGRGDAYFSSISHDDAASAVVTALALPAGTYNVGDDEPLPRRQWADALADTLGVAPPRLLPRWLTRLGGSPAELFSRSQRLSNRKLRDASSWTPKFPSAREGFAAIAVGR